MPDQYAFFSSLEFRPSYSKMIHFQRELCIEKFNFSIFQVFFLLHALMEVVIVDNAFLSSYFRKQILLFSLEFSLLLKASRLPAFSFSLG